MHRGTTTSAATAPPTSTAAVVAAAPAVAASSSDIAGYQGGDQQQQQLAVLDASPHGAEVVRVSPLHLGQQEVVGVVPSAAPAAPAAAPAAAAASARGVTTGRCSPVMSDLYRKLFGDQQQQEWEHGEQPMEAAGNEDENVSQVVEVAGIGGGGGGDMVPAAVAAIVNSLDLSNL